MTKKQSAERDEAIARLRETLKPGDTVYTSVVHVSRSGMQREIKVYAIETPYVQACSDNNCRQHREPTGPPQPVWLSGYASKATQFRLGKRDGLVVGGCGMDMGFHVTYELSHALYPEWECIGERCPSNDHVNYRGPRDKEPRGAGVIHKNGYALRHRWL